MKMKYWFAAISMAIIFIFLTCPLALAGRGCTGGTVEDPEQFIETFKTAPGTKYTGPVTIYYANATACAFTYGTEYYRDMYFFVRLKSNLYVGGNLDSGSDFLSFSGVENCVPYHTGSGYGMDEMIVFQQLALEKFFALNVNPYIYGEIHYPDTCNPLPTDCDPTVSDPNQECPSCALKAFSNVVEDMGDGLSTGLEFVIMDVVIAIDD